jgi:hypothetical protein
MTDWRGDPNLEAQSSKDKRAEASREYGASPEYAAAIARGGKDWARNTPPVLSPDALHRINRAPELPVAERAEPVTAQLDAVLEQLAHRALHREAFNGLALSIPDDLEKMLRAWKRMNREESRKQARDNAHALLAERVAAAAGKGTYGPIPSPFDHPEIFKLWLADVATAHGVAWELLQECLNPAVLEAVDDKAARVAATEALLGRAPASHRSLDGGRHADRERNLRTLKLLAVYWLRFGVEPNGAIANKRPVRGGVRSHHPADGGCATRFVHAFETEIARVIKDRALSDPTRVVGRPCRWKAETEGAVNTRIRRLIDWHSDLNEYGEAGSAYARARPWERWTLAVNAAGAVLPMLTRAR